MGLGKGLFKSPGQQVEVNGHQQAAQQNSQGKIRRKKEKPDHAGRKEQNPIGAGNEFNYSLLNFHRVSFERNLAGSVIIF